MIQADSDRIRVSGIAGPGKVVIGFGMWTTVLGQPKNDECQAISILIANTSLYGTRERFFPPFYFSTSVLITMIEMSIRLYPLTRRH